MGLTKYSAKKFTIFNAFATVVWALVVGYASFYMGEVILNMADEFKMYGIAAVVIIILSVTYYIRKI